MNGYPLTCLATVESHEQVCDKAFRQNIGLPFAKVSKMFVNFHCFTKKCCMYGKISLLLQT